MQVIANIKAGSRPNGRTVRPDGKRVYASADGVGTAAVGATASNAKIAGIAVGALPWGVALR